MKPFPGETGRARFDQLAPRVGAGILDRTRVIRVAGYRSMDVIVTQRHVAPPIEVQLIPPDDRRRALSNIAGQYALDLAVQQENVEASRRVRDQGRSPDCHVGHGQDGEIVFGK